MKTWQKPLFYYISRLTESEEDAWDVMQEVWLRVFRGIRSVRSPEAMPAWLYKVAHNTCMSHIRVQGRRQSMTTEMDEEAAAEIPCPEPQGFSSRRIHEALDELPLLEREALTLHFLEVLSVQ